MELYKYLKLSVGLDVLQTGRICFSPPQKFNDPFELKPNIAGFAPSDELDPNMERLPQILESEHQGFPLFMKASLPYERYVELTKKRLWPESDAQTGTQTLAPHLRKAFEDRLEEIVGILCLTESHENLTMWAHYGDKHQGMVIGFDATHPYFQNSDENAGTPRHLKPVIYHGSRPKLNWSGLTSEDILLTKGEDWECEKEWRMFAQLDKAEIEQTEAGPIHLFSYPPESVTKVIIGCRAKPEAVDQVKIAMASIPNLSRAVLFKATADPANYCLNFDKI
ncbi:MAG: DUF2971 domain-containing protein [Gallionella sp.]|jgi:hypothetical protein|nr:DUF2971 domain-containing protein [Gallionella sp.]MCK9353137.1 DUF2971 domain-containing protein [Gallionella sp.]